MPVNCTAIRDASLTTKFRVQNALSAFRLTYPQPGFPVGNTYFPEQFRNTISAEVPLAAKQGTCQCDQTSYFVQNPYGFQAPTGGNSIQ
jgi:hypothetical protein